MIFNILIARYGKDQPSYDGPIELGRSQSHTLGNSCKVGSQTFVGLYDDCLDVHPTLDPWFITHIEAI